jgi:hypothetical protein
MRYHLNDEDAVSRDISRRRLCIVLALVGSTAILLPFILGTINMELIKNDWMLLALSAIGLPCIIGCIVLSLLLLFESYRAEGSTEEVGKLERIRKNRQVGGMCLALVIVSGITIGLLLFI